MSDQFLTSQEPQDQPRSASVQLRQGRAEAEGLMDPANQSLADALRITYRVVQFAMVVLAALFVFSGVQRVDEGQSGIRLLFGKPTSGGELEPGARFSAPFPLGEIVKVESGTTKLEIMRTYWPMVGQGAEEMEVDKLQALPQIAPGRDGSLVTADLNLAHAQWKVEYKRVNPRDYAENILPDDEERIVGGAVRSGIVRVVAETPIDALLKQSERNAFSVASRVMSIAQERLDAMDSGIRLDNVTLYRVTAPARLRPDFAGVLAAASSASTLQQEAQGAGAAIFNGIAGGATADLVELIDKYEVATELGESARAEELRAAINAVFDGQAVEIDGVTLGAGLVSGEVTAIISGAKTVANALRESAEADLQTFHAKVSQFEANPELMMFRDWVSAYNTFTGQPFVQTQILPGSVSWRLLINADPDLAKDIYRDMQERKIRENERERLEKLRRDPYERANNPTQTVG